MGTELITTTLQKVFGNKKYLWLPQTGWLNSKGHTTGHHVVCGVKNVQLTAINETELGVM